MVAIIERNRDFKFLTNKELLEQAKINSKKQGTTLLKALDLFVKQVAITEEINLMSEEELEKERLFRQLQTEVNESIAEYKTGKYYTEEDLNERYGL